MSDQHASFRFYDARVLGDILKRELFGLHLVFPLIAMYAHFGIKGMSLISILLAASFLSTVRDDGFLRSLTSLPIAKRKLANTFFLRSVLMFPMINLPVLLPLAVLLPGLSTGKVLATFAQACVWAGGVHLLFLLFPVSLAWAVTVAYSVVLFALRTHDLFFDPPWWLFAGLALATAYAWWHTTDLLVAREEKVEFAHVTACGRRLLLESPASAFLLPFFCMLGMGSLGLLYPSDDKVFINHMRGWSAGAAGVGMTFLVLTYATRLRLLRSLPLSLAKVAWTSALRVVAGIGGVLVGVVVTTAFLSTHQNPLQDIQHSLAWALFGWVLGPGVMAGWFFSEASGLWQGFVVIAFTGVAAAMSVLLNIYAIAGAIPLHSWTLVGGEAAWIIAMLLIMRCLLGRSSLLYRLPSL